MWHCKWFKYIGAVVVMMTATGAHAQTIALAWDAVSEPDLASYVVYKGTATGVYGTGVDVGNVLTSTQAVGSDCANYYIAVKAKDTSGNLSTSFSNEVSGWARVRLTSASPAVVQRGQTYTVALTGANFQPGLVTVSGTGVTVSAPTVTDCQHATVQVTVSAAATVGARVVEYRRGNDNVYGTGSVLTVQGDTVPPVQPSNARRTDVRPPL